MILNIFTDGGSRGNPGPAAIGVVIKDSSGTVLHSFGKTIGSTTNNQAEYQAVIASLEWLIAKPPAVGLKGLNFFLDSTLVVNQLNGLWKVKDANLRQQIILVRQLEATVRLPIKYRAIPRTKNASADRLVNLALDKKL